MIIEYQPETPSTLAAVRAGAALVVRLVVDASGREALVITERRDRPAADRLTTLGLSRREADVLALVAEGKRNAEIAQLLFVSSRTVKKHLEGVYRKLGVHTRTAAAALALSLLYQ